jgi:hypothetical protein
MTIYAHCRRKGKRADQVEVKVGTNQVKVQAGKDQTFPSSDNRPNNRSHPSRCYQNNVPSLLQQQSLEEAKKWAAAWNMSVEDIMVSQDKLFPMAVVAPKPKFVMGEPFVSKERLEELLTHMCQLHAWYLTATKNGRIMIVANVHGSTMANPKRSISNLTNSSRCTIAKPSTNLP